MSNVKTVLIGYGVSLLITLFWASYVTTVLWDWFVVPFGVMSLSMPHAIGLGLAVQALTGSFLRDAMQSFKEGNALSYKVAVFCSICVPLLSLVAGAIAHAYM